MKAVVKYDNVDGATELRDVAVPEIGPDDVLVKVAYTGIAAAIHTCIITRLRIR